MKSQLFLAHIGLFSHINGMWGFIALVLLILFVTLVVSDSSNNQDK
jgi:hypothetical protein